ncbi:MAG: hypothetical protein JWQ00_812 [Noviherbaspirillum sp.]|nr:hypothetical protein [Noviherbaspirillum sp.]
MDEQNKDMKKPISSGVQPGPGERLQDATQQTTSASGSTGGIGGRPSTASSAAGSSGGVEADVTGGSAGSNTPFSTANLKESGARITAGAKQYAGDMANRVKEQGRSMFDQKKETAVGQVENVASAIRSTATHLQDEGQPQVARYIGMAADQLESFSNRLRDKDLDSIISDAQNLARRSPTTFFVGTVVTGFLLARFLKSSTERNQTWTDRSAADWRSPSDSGTAQSASRSSASGSMSAGGTSAGDSRSTGAGTPSTAATASTNALNGSRAGGSTL